MRNVAILVATALLLAGCDGNENNNWKSNRTLEWLGLKNPPIQGTGRLHANQTITGQYLGASAERLWASTTLASGESYMAYRFKGQPTPALAGFVWAIGSSGNGKLSLLP